MRSQRVFHTNEGKMGSIESLMAENKNTQNHKECNGERRRNKPGINPYVDRSPSAVGDVPMALDKRRAVIGRRRTSYLQPVVDLDLFARPWTAEVFPLFACICHRDYQLLYQSCARSPAYRSMCADGRLLSFRRNPTWVSASGKRVLSDHEEFQLELE